MVHVENSRRYRRQSYLTRGAVASERCRQRVLRNGGIAGAKLWTKRDDEALRRLYPDYRAAQKALGRTYGALRSRARDLKLVCPRPLWTCAEISRLRRLSRTMTYAEMTSHFPGRSANQLQKTASRFCIRKDRPPLKLLGEPLVDAVRQRARALGFSMPELAAELGKRRAFCSNDSVGLKTIAKAVAFLDGRMTIVWND